jgi:hypothetical protein
MKDPPPIGTKQFSAVSALGLAFSPDGKELAGCFGSAPGYRLVCWSEDTEVVFDHYFQANLLGRSDAGNLQWAPDGSGWLPKGRVFIDRGARRLVWKLDTEHNVFGARFLDADTLLVNRARSHTTPTLVQLRFPRAAIDASLDAIESGVDAYVRPGSPVNVDVQLGTIMYSDRSQVVRELTQAISERLEALGLTVAPDAPTKLLARYSEAPGKTIRVDRHGRRYPFAGRAGTGPSVQETKGRLELVWAVDDGQTPLWYAEVASGAPGNRLDSVTSATLRERMFKNLLYWLADTQIPYFIPRNRVLDQLPIMAKPEYR